jgi:prepilin-type N-terminal cleavage/methylation domain-containing protein
MSKAKGFTLIEITIVLVVIGILAGLSIPRMVDISGAARNTAAQANTATFRTLYDTFIGDKSKSSPAAPWPTLYEIGGGSPPKNGFSKTAGTASTIFSQTTIAPSDFKTCKEASDTLLAYFRASPSDYYHGDTSRSAIWDYTASPSGCSVRLFIHSSFPGVMNYFTSEKRQAYFAKISIPAIPGILPVAVDNSGYCMSDGVKVTTYKDGASTLETNAPDDTVKSIGVMVGDEINCPAGTFPQ